MNVFRDRKTVRCNWNRQTNIVRIYASLLFRCFCKSPPKQRYASSRNIRWNLRPFAAVA